MKWWWPFPARKRRPRTAGELAQAIADGLNRKFRPSFPYRVGYQAGRLARWSGFVPAAHPSAKNRLPFPALAQMLVDNLNHHVAREDEERRAREKAAKRAPLACKASDGRIFVIDDGFAALRSPAGVWSAPIGITGDTLARYFWPLPDADAAIFAAEARAALLP